MKRLLFKILVTIIFAVIFISCKKGSTNVVIGNLEMLTQAPWKIIKYEERTNSGPYMDVFPSVPACTQDDQYVFAVNNTYQLTEGPTKCNASDPQIIFTGTWQFAQSETHLQIDNTDYAINKLSDTLVLSNSSILVPDTSYTRITLIH